MCYEFKTEKVVCEIDTKSITYYFTRLNPVGSWGGGGGNRWGNRAFPPPLKNHGFASNAILLNPITQETQSKSMNEPR